MATKQRHAFRPQETIQESLVRDAQQQQKFHAEQFKGWLDQQRRRESIKEELRSVTKQSFCAFARSASVDAAGEVALQVWSKSLSDRDFQILGKIYQDRELSNVKVQYRNWMECRGLKGVMEIFDKYYAKALCYATVSEPQVIRSMPIFKRSMDIPIRYAVETHHVQMLGDVVTVSSRGSVISGNGSLLLHRSERRTVYPSAEMTRESNNYHEPRVIELPQNETSSEERQRQGRCCSSVTVEACDGSEEGAERNDENSTNHIVLNMNIMKDEEKATTSTSARETVCCEHVKKSENAAEEATTSEAKPEQTENVQGVNTVPKLNNATGEATTSNVKSEQKENVQGGNPIPKPVEYYCIYCGIRVNQHAANVGRVHTPSASSCQHQHEPIDYQRLKEYWEGVCSNCQHQHQQPPCCHAGIARTCQAQPATPVEKVKEPASQIQDHTCSYAPAILKSQVQVVKEVQGNASSSSNNNKVEKVKEVVCTYSGENNNQQVAKVAETKETNMVAKTVEKEGTKSKENNDSVSTSTLVVGSSSETNKAQGGVTLPNTAETPGGTIDKLPYQIQDLWDYGGKTQPFPIFLVVISLLQVVLYYSPGNARIYWTFLFHPYRRFEMWRYFTPTLLHCRTNGSDSHLWVTVFLQFLLSFFIERKVGPINVALVYVGSAVFGVLTTSLTVPWGFKVGGTDAAAGVLLSIISYAVLQLKDRDYWRTMIRIGIILVVFAALEIMPALVFDFPLELASSDIGGAVAGILFGFMLYPESDEIMHYKYYFRQVAVVVAGVFLAVAVFGNIFYQSTFEGAPGQHNAEWFETHGQEHFYEECHGNHSHT